MHFVQHSHTDLGYTHPRDEVWRLQMRNLAQAIEYCKWDGDFRWTVECFWPLDEALRHSYPFPDEFIEYVKRGRISITATYFHGSDHFDVTDWRRLLSKSKKFCDEHGLPLRSGMQCDVNGITALLPDLLNEIGVTRFVLAINTDRGGYPFERPNAFYWRGVLGGKILVFNGFIYLRANELRMHEGKDKFVEGVKKLREELEKVNFSLPGCLLQGGGSLDDNATPGLWMSEMSRWWNENHKTETDIEFVCSTIDQFFDDLESEAQNLPEYRGTLPDWWSDGHLSAPLETQRAYEARRKLRAVESLLHEKEKRMGSVFDEVQRNIWFYFEHTFGSWRSISEPEAPDSKRQWFEKGLCAHFAYEETSNLAEEALERARKAGSAIFFPRGRHVQDCIEIEISRWEFSQEGEIVFEDNPINVRAFVHFPEEPWKQARCFIFVPPFSLAEGTKEGQEKLITIKQREFIPKEFRKSSDLRMELPFEFIYEEPLGSRYDVRDQENLEFKRVNGEYEFMKSFETPLWFSTIWNLYAPNWETLSAEVRRWREFRVVECVIRGKRLEIRKPHADFVRLEWKKAKEVWAETGGFWHRPGIDELPNACKDWHVVQGGVEIVYEKNTSVGFWTPDAPLVHFGGPNTGKWGKNIKGQNGVLAVNLFNNYWHTNFVASAPGWMEYRFRIIEGNSREVREILSSWNASFLVLLDTPNLQHRRIRRVKRLKEWF